MTEPLQRLAFLCASLVVAGCATTGGAPQGGGSSTGETGGAPSGSESSGPASTGEQFVPAVVGVPDDPGTRRTYRIGPHDRLKIEVFQVDDLSSEERVNDDGFIVMPLIGSVSVGGLTPREAEQAIAQRLGERYLQDPEVNIFVVEYASQKVTVTGQVKKPGVFPLAGETTLMQAIALAGGVDDVANKEEVIVFRKHENGKVNAYVVDLGSVEEGKLADPIMVGDDRVVVPKSGVAVFSKAVGNVLTGWAIRVPFL